MQFVLSINGGSSSIRFARYHADGGMTETLKGKLDIALPAWSMGLAGEAPSSIPCRSSAAGFLIDWLTDRGAFDQLAAVGHRVVHGMQHTEPAPVTAALLASLRGITARDPEHLPLELELIESIRKRYPAIPQVVCFDTSFHRTMPREARQLSIPRRYEAMGVQRYGFHGLAYASLLEELQLMDPAAAAGRIIFAHLGGGASLAAVLNGRSMDTSMGFTPAGGVMMGTRSGDLDPGILSFLSQTENMSASGLQQMLTRESGLLGVSETSADMRQLMISEATDERAAEAVTMFCYQIKKGIGAYAAALGGLDTLVFSGGIGENCDAIRTRICHGLEFLGVSLEEPRNAVHALLVSRAGARVKVRVIPANEELVVAKHTCRLALPAS